MKVSELIDKLMEIDPNAEVKVASASEGNPLVEDIDIVRGGINGVLIQTQSFVAELTQRAKDAGFEISKPLKLVQ